MISRSERVEVVCPMCSRKFDVPLGREHERAFQCCSDECQHDYDEEAAAEMAHFREMELSQRQHDEWLATTDEF